MLLYLGGSCETGKGNIGKTILEEGTRRGETISLCLDPMEQAAMELAGKSFSHLVSRRVFASQRGLALKLYRECRKLYEPPAKGKILVVNESPLSFLASITFFGFLENLTVEERAELLSLIVEDCNAYGARHLLVRPWGGGTIAGWVDTLTLAYRNLANGRTVTLDLCGGYNETQEAALAKARQILGWEVN